MIIWVFQCNVCIYIYIHLEININMETRHYIKMRRKHQRNSSYFPTGKCQILYVVKLWAIYWVGYDGVEHCLSPREQWFLLEPGPSAPPTLAFCSRTMGRGLVRSLTQPQQTLVGWSRAGLNFNYSNAFTVLPCKIMYHCRAGKRCFRLYFVLIPPFFYRSFQVTPFFCIVAVPAGETPAPSPPFQQGQGPPCSSSGEHHRWKWEPNEHFGHFFNLDLGPEEAGKCFQDRVAPKTAGLRGGRLVLGWSPAPALCRHLTPPP